MKKSHLIISSLFLSLLLGSCGSKKDEQEVTPSDKTIIRILHQEDYMDEELLAAFEEEYPECQVVFDTSDTNETVYNQLRTGKSEYNLLTVSEYMIQRMASEGLIQKINLPEESDYKINVSPWLTNSEHTGKIDNIKVKDYKTGEELGILSEYTAGFMWGTLGTVVNPYFKKYQERGMEKDKIIEDLRGNNGWSTFWNPEYKGTHSVKDSMRDTYALGIFELYKDKFMDENLSYDEKNTYFNDHSRETIGEVKDKLIDLKGNIFGFEVDSGKNDIVTGKIGMNLAWSGDAAFSILQGEYYPGEDESYEEEKPEDKKTKLYYSIPKCGSNVWFDGFAMPVGTDPNSKEYEYTIKFIDFLSRPENVVANMLYTGYTSFISGVGADETNLVRNYVLENYDCSEDAEASTYEPYDVSYFFNNGTEEETIILADADSFEGRSLVAVYPSKDDLDNLYVMEDYGRDNGRIVQMWEDIKVNPLPLWVDIFLVTFFVVLIGYLSTYKIVKNRKVRRRKELRKEL